MLVFNKCAGNRQMIGVAIVERFKIERIETVAVKNIIDTK